MDRKADIYDGTHGKLISEEEKFKFKDLKTFNRSFWLICFSCVLVYVAIFPYIQVVSDMLQTKFHFSEAKAGALFGIPYIISACASPFLGYFIDRFGKRVLLSKLID
jgi:MFS family permease